VSEENHIVPTYEWRIQKIEATRPNQPAELRTVVTPDTPPLYAAAHGYRVYARRFDLLPPACARQTYQQRYACRCATPSVKEALSTAALCAAQEEEQSARHERQRGAAQKRRVSRGDVSAKRRKERSFPAVSLLPIISPIERGVICSSRPIV